MASTLLVIASIVIVPFLTYYATSTLFFRKVNSKSAEKRPPTLPYFIPGIYHTIGFARLGARKYFAELIKDYGTFAPFSVQAGPRSYVVLRDPTHISRVLDAPEHLTADTVKVDMLDKLFGSLKAAEHLRQSEASTQRENGERPVQVPFQVPDTSLALIAEVYISILSANMHNKMFQSDSWTRIEDLWSFLQLVLLRCTLHTLFGSALLKQYPRILRDYLDFDAAVEGFVYGMPRVMISGATKPRDRLHQGLSKWLAATSAEIDNADKHDDAHSSPHDSVWDEKMGLQFIRKRYTAFKSDKVEEATTKARAVEVLSILYTSITGLISPTFWLTIETLRKSHLTHNITANVDQHFSPMTHKYDVLGLIQEPLVKSLQAEIHRLRTATSVIRTNKTDGFPLDKQWSLPRGTTVAMFSHDISLNTDVWKKVQPRALDRPLEEFWAERFMLPNQKNKSKKNVGVDVGGSATDNLNDLVTQLASCNQYPGSRFVSALQMATLAVFFAEFEIQLCDLEQVDTALPPVREFAYGTVKPLENIAVRIRKRKT